MFKLCLLLICVGVVFGGFFSLGEFDNKAVSLSQGFNLGGGNSYGPTQTFDINAVRNFGAVDGPTGQGAISLEAGTQANTQGSNDQLSKGSTDSSMSLINNFFATRASGLTESEGSSNPRVSSNDTRFGDGSSSQFAAQTVQGTTALNFETPSSFSTGTFNATAQRDGLGASQSTGFSSTDSVTLDAVNETATTADAFGGSDAIAISFDGITFVEGTTYSQTDTDSAQAGCQMKSTAAGATSEFPEDSIASKSGCQVTAAQQPLSK